MADSCNPAFRNIFFATGAPANRAGKRHRLAMPENRTHVLLPQIPGYSGVLRGPIVGPDRYNRGQLVPRTRSVCPRRHAGRSLLFSRRSFGLLALLGQLRQLIVPLVVFSPAASLLLARCAVLKRHGRQPQRVRGTTLDGRPDGRPMNTRSMALDVFRRHDDYQYRCSPERFAHRPTRSPKTSTVRPICPFVWHCLGTRGRVWRCCGDSGGGSPHGAVGSAPGVHSLTPPHPAPQTKHTHTH